MINGGNSIKIVCAVRTTYGNRFNFLKQVVDSVLKKSIPKIVTVNNVSVREVRDS